MLRLVPPHLSQERKMRFSKVSCPACAHYSKCPQQTRMFVNYCGSNPKSMEVQIKKAISECRAHRGQLFQKGFVVDMTTLPETKELAVSVV